MNASATDKSRVFVLTDIENEPDDAMSMVRFLIYANHYDIEGLVATTSIHQRGRVAPQRIRQIVEAYGKVRDNLERHEPGFPTAEFLLARISEGLAVYGMDGVGEGKDSPGSELLIRAVDKADPRPLWITVWGGPSVLAQALWKVRATRSAEQLQRFVAKLRVYTISDQDNSGPWLRQEFPDLFYITNPGFNAGGAYHHATWSGISGDYFHGRFVGVDFSLVTNEWLDRHIRRKGPLGAEYPLWEYLMEGDTPSFLNLINNGLSHPEHPNWGGWGGRYVRIRANTWLDPVLEPGYKYPEGRWYTRSAWGRRRLRKNIENDQELIAYLKPIWRWTEALQNDFASRADWCVESYENANHPPKVVLGHAMDLSVRPGAQVKLSAKATTDPDGDKLTYRWWQYEEADTYGEKVTIENADKQDASFTVPADTAKGQTIHIICEVTDSGTPALTRYQRVVAEIQ